MELKILLVETAIFSALIKEFSSRAAQFAVSANLISLFLGGLLIVNLPI